MKKIVLILLFLNNFLFSDSDDGTCVWQIVDSGTSVSTNYNTVPDGTVNCEAFQKNTYTYIDNDKKLQNEWIRYGCPADMTREGDTCVCPAGEELVSSQTCPASPSPTLSCKLPCADGYSRNSAGECCPNGLDVFCDIDTHLWSDCKCPDGNDMIDNGNGIFSCASPCDENSTRGGADVGYECIPNCNICNGVEDQAEQACQEMGQYLIDFSCIPNAECTDFVPSGSCVNAPNCTECAERQITRADECRILHGAYLSNFECSENLETCEVTNYNAGECIDDDSNPSDPNFGDGSQGNNDETNDIPDTNNSGQAIPIDSDNDPSNGNDGKGGFDIDMPDYNPALETIGDNIEDGTKATNAQTKANKQNTEYLGKKLDDIVNNTKDIKDALDSDGSQISRDHTPNQEFDKDGFKDIITGELSDITADFKTSVDTYWDSISGTYFERDYFVVTDCPTLPTLTFTLQGQDVVLISQERFDSYGILPILKKIVIFIFTLSGVMYAFRSE